MPRRRRGAGARPASVERDALGPLVDRSTCRPLSDRRPFAAAPRAAARTAGSLALRGERSAKKGSSARRRAWPALVVLATGHLAVRGVGNGEAVDGAAVARTASPRRRRASPSGACDDLLFRHELVIATIQRQHARPDVLGPVRPDRRWRGCRGRTPRPGCRAAARARSSVVAPPKQKPIAPQCPPSNGAALAWAFNWSSAALMRARRSARCSYMFFARRAGRRHSGTHVHAVDVGHQDYGRLAGDVLGRALGRGSCRASRAS